MVFLSKHCDDGSAVVGLSLEGGWLHHAHKLICLPTPPELAFTAATTTNKCTQLNIKACLTMTCPSGTIYKGPKSIWMGNLSSCSMTFSSTVAILDESDCHEVQGDMQTKPAIATNAWAQWRYCEGSSTAYYVMTGAVVTSVSASFSELTSIKCCRVKPI